MTPASAPSPSLAWARTSFAPAGELARRLEDALRTAGVKPTSARRLYGAVLSKMMPVVAGPAGLEALVAFSRVTCGGRWTCLQVGPSWLDPGDLVGYTYDGEVIPRPGGLLEATQRAEEFDGPSLVILEGLNRAPVETYLLPLLRRRELGLNVLTHLPIRGNVPLSTSPKLLFAATMVGGPTLLPISGDLWDSAVLIEADRGAPSGAHATPTEIPVERLHAVGVGDQTIVDEVLAEVKAAEYVLRSSLGRYCAGLLAAGVKDREQLHDALYDGIVVPWLLSFSNEERTSILEESQVGDHQLASLDRVRRRLA